MTAAAGAQEPARSVEERALMQADRAFCEATQREGVEGWLAYFASSAIVFPNVGPIARGAQERANYFRGRVFPPAGFAWEPDAAWCASSGDLGFTRGHWSADAPAAQAARPEGRYLSIWKRNGERWEVLADLGDDPQFFAEQPADDPAAGWRFEVQFEAASQANDLRIEAGVVHTAKDRSGKYLRVYRRAADASFELAHATGAWDLATPRMQTWEAADRLFRGDPRWRGGDGASSLALDADRVLWLFADSFVAAPQGQRAGSRMVRNSIGIQSQRDPLHATMQFHWDESAATPASFFRLNEVAESERWLWPASGIRIGTRLLLFFFVVEPEVGGLGFRLSRSRAAWIDEPERDARAWKLRWIEALEFPADALIGGAGCVIEGEHVIALSPRGSEHAVVALRWSKSRLEAGEFSPTETWCGAFGWQTLSTTPHAPQALFAPAQSELTLWPLAPSQWLATHGLGFGAAPLGVRHAAALEGPWSGLQVLHRPAEAAREKILIYAAKAHPELHCAHGIAVTYVANSLDFATLVADETLYYPRFLCLQWQ